MLFLFPNFKNLKYLDLSFNNLVGNIPSELFNIEGLTHVYLQRNGLTGWLPKSAVLNASLQVLCLEFNQLQGEPPSGWEQSNIRELHLHGNNFVDNSVARTRLVCELGNQCEVSV